MKKINEIFYSLQGEGYYTGTPAVFVRFSGCNLNCDFCDTEHLSGVFMSDNEILTEITQYPTRHIVLTGGEPTLQIDVPFMQMLKEDNWYIQIETNGTLTSGLSIADRWASQEQLNQIAAEQFDGTIENHSILFSGLCPDCKKKNTH